MNSPLRRSTLLLSDSRVLAGPTGPANIVESGTVTNVRGTIGMARVVGAAGLAAPDTLGGMPVYDLTIQLGSAFGELPVTTDSLSNSSPVLVNGVATVPEPAPSLLVAAGLVALAAIRRRSPGNA